MLSRWFLTCILFKIHFRCSAKRMACFCCTSIAQSLLLETTSTSSWWTSTALVMGDWRWTRLVAGYPFAGTISCPVYLVSAINAHELPVIIFGIPSIPGWNQVVNFKRCLAPASGSPAHHQMSVLALNFASAPLASIASAVVIYGFTSIQKWYERISCEHTLSCGVLWVRDQWKNIRKKKGQVFDGVVFESPHLCVIVSISSIVFSKWANMKRRWICSL